jgi:probable HAF family extracellular repeat protein
MRIIVGAVYRFIFATICLQPFARGADFFGLGTTGVTLSIANDVSADGSVIVGSYTNSSGQFLAFKWTASTGLQSLGDLASGPTASAAYKVSDDGSVITGYGTPSQDPGDTVTERQAVKWIGSSGPTPLSSSLAPQYLHGNYATTVSHDGTFFAGAYTINGSNNGYFTVTSSGTVSSMGYFDTNFLPHTDYGLALDFSASGNIAVGYDDTTSGSPGVKVGYYWVRNQGALPLPALGAGTQASAVSSDGITAAGQSASQACIWKNISSNGVNLTATAVGLGFLSGGSISAATDISGSGHTVVGWGNTASGNRAFLYTDQTGMIDLGTYLTQQGVDLSGWTLTQANAISGDGSTIVGTGTHNGVTEAWAANLVSVPEPSSFAMLGVGALVIGGRRRFRSFD